MLNRKPNIAEKLYKLARKRTLSEGSMEDDVPQRHGAPEDPLAPAEAADRGAGFEQDELNALREECGMKPTMMFPSLAPPVSGLSPC